MSRRLRKFSLTPWIWIEAWDWYVRGWATLMRVAAMMPKNAIHNNVALRRYSVRAHSMALHSWPLAECGKRVFEIRRRVPWGNVNGHGSASSKQNQLTSCSMTSIKERVVGNRAELPLSQVQLALKLLRQQR